jgi:hypothetical protein
MRLLWLAVGSHRTGAIAMSLIGAFSGLLNAVGYVQIAGHTPAERQVFAAQMEILGRQLSYLLPAPLELDTMGGYLTWRAFGSVALLYTIWAAIAATGAARGDEEKGLTETWLAAGVSRARWLLTRSAGFVIAAAISVAVSCAATLLGTIAADDAVAAGPMALEALLILAITLFAFGVGTAVAQFVVTRRVAATVATALLIALYVFNSSSRAGADLGALRWLSPYYLFDRSSPLLAAGTFDLGSTLALLALWAVLAGFAVLAFMRRDVGGAIVRRGIERMRVTFRASGNALLRLPVLASVDQQRWWIAGWAAALALLGYFLTSLVRTMIDALASIPTFKVYLDRLGISAYSDFVGLIWFGTGLLLFSAMVIVGASGWAADDAEGRLESALAAGASRPRIAVERIAATLVAVGIVAAVSSLAVYAATLAYDISVPGDRFIVSTILVLPVAFAIAAIGQLLVGWRPRVAIVILSAVTIFGYFVLQFAPLFDWPAWVTNLSFFGLYGTPMTRYDWTGIAILMAIGIFGTAGSIVSLQRRDVGT